MNDMTEQEKADVIACALADLIAAAVAFAAAAPEPDDPDEFDDCAFG
jgi:hypothetical protein